MTFCTLRLSFFQCCSPWVTFSPIVPKGGGCSVWCLSSLRLISIAVTRPIHKRNNFWADRCDISFDIVGKSFVWFPFRSFVACAFSGNKSALLYNHLGAFRLLRRSIFSFYTYIHKMKAKISPLDGERSAKDFGIRFYSSGGEPI